jgi:hypothetical protein
MPTNDIKPTVAPKPPPPIPEPEPGVMWVVFQLQEAINEQIVTDLMNNITSSLQQVTHLISHADFKVNVGGVILTHSADIVPATVGDVVPTPQ